MLYIFLNMNDKTYFFNSSRIIIIDKYLLIKRDINILIFQHTLLINAYYNNLIN